MNSPGPGVSPTYKGERKDEKWNGYGEEVWQHIRHCGQSGDTYKGYFRDGKYDGEGVYTYWLFTRPYDPKELRGEFEKGKLVDDKCELELENKDKYEGNCKHHENPVHHFKYKPGGMGTMTHHDTTYTKKEVYGLWNDYTLLGEYGVSLILDFLLFLIPVSGDKKLAKKK